MASIALTRRPSAAGYWLPRALHPLAWWLWALGLAAAASRTLNPLLLAIIVGVVCWVVMARRSDGPWAQAFRLYLIGGVVIIVFRVVFRILFGGGASAGDHVLVHLPGIELPGSAGIQILGDVTAESLLSGLYDGMRLATMLICVGAANALANPRRLLRSMPPALSEVGTAVVVALSVFPQLAESVVRVRRARRLRPATGEKRTDRLHAIVVPVLEDALDRSLQLAASMDSRGYGRRGDRSRVRSLVIGALMLVGLGGACVGVYAMLDTTTPRLLAGPMLVAGLAIGVAGIVASGHGVRRSVYRPDSWRIPELLTAASGIVAATTMMIALHNDPTALLTPVSPPTWPELPTLPLVGILVGLLPSIVTPRPATYGAVEAVVA